MRIVLWAWAAAIALPALPLLRFSIDYSIWADALVGGCLVVMTAAYKGTRRRPRTPPAPYAPDKELAIVWALAVLGAIGCLLLLIDGGAKFSPSYLLENISTIRAVSFDRVAEDTRQSPLAVVGTLLAPCGLLTIIAAVKLRRRSLVAVGLLDLALFGLVGLLLLGGRTLLFMAVLLAVVSWRLSGHRVNFGPRTWLGVAAAVLLVSYFSVSWIKNRQGGDFSPTRELLITQRAEIPPWAAGNQNIATALLSFGYFASPLPALSYYTQKDPIPGPLYGAYSFPIVEHAWAKARGVPSQKRSVERAEVFAPFEESGYYGNVWATLIRDLLVDFRWPGTLACFAIFGWLLAWARNGLESSGALHYHYLESISCYIVAFGAFTSYLWNPMIAIGLCTAIAVMFVTRAKI